MHQIKLSSPNNILNFNFVNYTDYLDWPMYKVLKQTFWYNNLMPLAGGTSVPRPQYWWSFCHLMDWNNRRATLVVNGGSSFSWETSQDSKYFVDNDKEWPKAELIGISIGRKFKDLSDGKSIGMFTDLNIFSSNIRNDTAEDITG